MIPILRSAAFPAVLFSCLLASAVVHCDTLQLRDGRVIVGTLDGADDTHVRFRQAHAQHTDVIPKSRIVQITFDVDSGQPGSAGVAAPAPAPMAVVRDESNSSSADIHVNGKIIPAGTVIAVRTIDSLQLNASQIGNLIRAKLEDPVVVNGETIATAGSLAKLQVSGVAGGNRLTGKGDILLQLVTFKGSTGQTYITATSEGVVADSSNTVLRGQQIQVRAGALLHFTLQQNIVF